MIIPKYQYVTSILEELSSFCDHNQTHIVVGDIKLINYFLIRDILNICFILPPKTASFCIYLFLFKHIAAVCLDEVHTFVCPAFQNVTIRFLC